MAEAYRQIRGENSSYRAGLVLGLTMAEIMLLLLFALLLIIGASWAVHKREQVVWEQKLADMQTQIARFAKFTRPDGQLIPVEEIIKQNDELQMQITELRIYEDTFREMRRAKPRARPEEIADRVRDIIEADLRMGSPNPDDVVRKFAESKAFEAAFPGKTAAEAARELAAAKAAEDALRGKSPAEVAEALKLAEDLKKELPGQAPQQIKDAAAAMAAIAKDLDLKPGDRLADAIRDLSAANSNMRGQNRMLIAENERLSGGKGSQLPSCWASPDGKAEAIFTIIFNETGIEVEERPQPHRAEQRRKLPLEMVRYGSTVSRDEFARMMRPLYMWSVVNECRFYVVLNSRTDNTSNASINVSNNFFYPASRIIRIGN